MMLTGKNASRRHSSVTLTRNASGETQIEVTVATDEAGVISTVEEAEERAREVYARLVAGYPASDGHDSAAVTLSRNARGETQIEVTTRTSDRDEGARTVAAAAELALEEYDRMRARYPLANGTSAKPGSVA